MRGPFTVHKTAQCNDIGTKRNTADYEILRFQNPQKIKRKSSDIRTIPK